MIELGDLTPVNSTSFVDLLGTQVGLERLPGEPAVEFLLRLRRAAGARRGSDYVGQMNGLLLDLGLEMREAVRVSCTKPDWEITVGQAEVTVRVQSSYFTTWLMEAGQDGFWRWRTISEIVADLSQQEYLTVEQLGDGLALELVRQSNVLLVTDEAIEGSTVTLGSRGALVADSVRFNVDVPEYTITGRTLHFVSPVPAGAAAMYRYRLDPFVLAASPVAMFSLQYPLIQTAAKLNNGKLVYQVCEYIQDVMRRDRSYWGK